MRVFVNIRLFASYLSQRLAKSAFLTSQHMSFAMYLAPYIRTQASEIRTRAGTQAVCSEHPGVALAPSVLFVALRTEANMLAVQAGSCSILRTYCLRRLSAGVEAVD